MKHRVLAVPSGREQRWVAAKVRCFGSFDAVLVHLVRLAIALDAESADNAAAQRRKAHLLRQGHAPADAARAVRAWRRKRETWRQRRRLHNLLLWALPGDRHFTGHVRRDDPRQPLSREVTRCLIATAFGPAGLNEPGVPVHLTLPAVTALAPDELRWLACQAARTGALEPVLRWLVLQGRFLEHRTLVLLGAGSGSARNSRACHAPRPQRRRRGP